jgi:hypothetical protein
MLHKHLRKLFVLLAIISSTAASAKVWRVNNNTGVSADFSQLTTAVASASVQNGDTIYLEGSATSYTNAVVSKRLVIIGPGYLLSGANGNPGLQFNPNDARFGVLLIDSAASGSTFIGMSTYVQVDSRADDLRFIRSSIYLEQWFTTAGSKANNWVLNKCMFGGILNFPMENLQVTNCIAAYLGVTFNNTINAFFRNNVFAVGLSTTSAYVANNIFLAGNTITSSVIKYNISVNNDLPAGFNNQVNVPVANIFVASGTDDGKYQLRAGSPAIGAGEPINGVTPDCGAFGTADPYRLSGIAPIPTIYSLTVPSSIPASATTMTVTFSTRSNN